MIAKIKKITFTRSFVMKFTLFVIFLALLHHTDHALRYDHSGWPVRPDPPEEGARLVTPFSYSLIVYPILISFFFIRNKIYRLTMTTLILLMVTFVHIFIEPPMHIYQTWAENSSPNGALVGHPNLLNIHSPELAVVAVILTALLSLALLFLAFAIWKEKPTH